MEETEEEAVLYKLAEAVSKEGPMHIELEVIQGSEECSPIANLFRGPILSCMLLC
jgi:hypothetical protein